MPQLYENFGVRFFYPEDWTVEDESGEEITVYSPEGAFWIVAVHPPGTNAEKLADEARTAMGAEYPGLESEPVSETVCDWPGVGFDMNFIYLDLVNISLVRCFETPAGTLVTFCQSEGREYERVAPVFRAMTQSVMDSLVGDEAE